MELENPCHVRPGRVTDGTGYIGIMVDGPGRGKRGQPKGRRTTVHRLAWERTYGPIPDGMFVLHHCDNRACDEPTHLFLGRHADNMADMRAKNRGSGRFTGATHCVHGHEFTEANTRRYTRDGRPARQCRTCLREASRRYHERHPH